MDEKIIACKTIETELQEAMRVTGCSYPVEWLESGLHATPKRLNKRLQEVVGQLHARRILLAMGFCGNSLAGLCSQEAELVIPRVDDCISLLLGSVRQRQRISRELSAYFLTEGWMRGERNIWVEYQYTVEKYGEENAAMVMDMMYGHYHTLALLDNGVEPIEDLLDSTKIIADTFHLEQKVLPATLGYLEKLLTGPWEEEEFLVIPPGMAVTSTDMRLVL